MRGRRPARTPVRASVGRRAVLLALPALLGLGLGLGPGLGGTAAAAAPATAPVVTGDDDVLVTVTVPGTQAAAFTVSDAQLRWSLNAETGSGAYAGGCNFLMAGTPGTTGDAGGSHAWTDPGLYHSAAGDVRVERPTAAGDVLATFDTRCDAADGTRVTTADRRTTGTQVVLEGGTGRVDPAAGTARIAWEGSFTVVFYGGYTSWWATDPVLEVDATGAGRLTATVGGYGTSREDASVWRPLAPRQVTLAELPAVTLADPAGLRAQPAYVGRAVTVPAGATPQAARTAANADHWGAFPQDFVDFQDGTGQGPYWYTSGGAGDARKVATPLYVSYDADVPVERDPTVVVPGGIATGATAGTGGPAGAATVSRPVTRGGLATTSAPALAAPAAPDGVTFVPAVAARTLGAGGAGLVPALAAAVADPGERLALGTTGLLLATAGTVVGFRRGWLVLPFRT